MNRDQSSFRNLAGLVFRPADPGRLDRARFGNDEIPLRMLSSEMLAGTMLPGSGDGSTADPDADTEGDGEAPRQGALMGRLQGGWRVFFIGIWLVYLVPTVLHAWDFHGPVRRVAGVLAVLVFAVLYVVVLSMMQRIRTSLAMEPGWAWNWALIGTQVALILVALPAAGESVLGMFVYLAVLTMFVLPARPAWAMIGLNAASVLLLSNLVPGWRPQDLLAAQILVTALAIWGIIQLLQRNNQLAQAREELTGLAVSQERLRFSRDLHDILGHSLTVITLKAELAGRLIAADPERAAREIAEVEELARTALADVRATVAGYRDVTLAAELASARTALDAAGIEADLAGTVDDVPAERRELFGWAVREGVTNVVRHSGARGCRVSVDRRLVEISDDGRGPGRCEPGDEPEGERTVTGNGLAGLRERAEAVGARLSVGRSEQGGFLLRVTW